MRNDSILNTGMNSVSLGVNEDPIRKAKLDEKTEKRQQFTPHAKIVFDELQKEIDELSNINFANVKELVASGIPNALEIDMLSNEKTIERLQALKARLNNLLRTKPVEILEELLDE